MNQQSEMWTAIAVAFLLLALGFAMQAMADPKVKYCKDAQTGRVITVEAGMPCPYPTHEI